MTGKVYDSSGESIIGASVMVQGTMQGAVSYTHLDVYKRQDLNIYTAEL